MIATRVHKSGDIVLSNSGAGHPDQNHRTQERFPEEVASLNPQLFLVSENPRERSWSHGQPP